MAYTYILLSTAQEEYESSISWYGERSWAAAGQFAEAIDHALELICEHPFRWRNEYRNYYEIGVKKFPFSIIYTVDEDQEIVIISAVYHHSRNPKKKYRK